jgi:hypothetical protein
LGAVEVVSVLSVLVDGKWLFVTFSSRLARQALEEKVTKKL